MSESEKDRLFREGVAAIRAGDKAAGREKLQKVVEIDQFHEQAWLWLSAVVETRDEKITCLQNALTVNPRSEPARRGLAQLGVQLEGADSAPPEPAVAAKPAAAPVKPGEEWRADLYKGQPSVSSADLSAGKLVSDATIVRIEEEVNRSVLDLTSAWISALIFKVAGDYREHVEDGPVGHILLNVSVSILFRVITIVAVIAIFFVLGRSVESFVSSYNAMTDQANAFSAVGLVPAPFRPAVEYLEQQSGGAQFSAIDAAVLGSLGAVFLLIIVVMILLTFTEQLFRAMILNSVATWLGGKGAIIQTTQALTIALVVKSLAGLIGYVLWAVLPDSVGWVVLSVVGIYQLLQDAVAIDASHRLGILASIGAVIIGGVAMGIILSCLSGLLAIILP